MSAPLPRLLAALLLVASARAAGAADPSPSPLAPEDWPPGLPLVQMAGWEAYRGAYAGDAGRVSYELFVDPSRIGIYRVTRYRITPPPGTEGELGLPLESVQFVARPGQAPPLCYQRRVAAGTPRPWLLLVPGTPAYNAEMFRGIEVFHRQQEAHLKALGQ